VDLKSENAVCFYHTSRMSDYYVDSPRSPSPTPFPATGWQLLNYLIGEANDGAEREIRHSRLIEEIGELKYRRLLLNQCMNCGMLPCLCMEELKFQVIFHSM